MATGKKQPNKYPQGRIYEILRPHKVRIHDLFDLYFNSRRGKSEIQNHNDLIKVRNTLCEELLDAYRDITVKANLPPGSRIHAIPRDVHANLPCAICGSEQERKRTHIIPLRLGGSDSAANIVYLCPKHKEKFSHAELPSGDWNKLKSSITDDAASAYLIQIVQPKQEIFWKTLTQLPPPSDFDSSIGSK